MRGRTPDGDDAPTNLLKDARLEVIGSGGIVRVEGLNVTAVAPGAVVVRAIVGDLHVDAPVSVVAAPAVTQKPRATVTTRPRKPPTTVTTIYEEEAPPPPPKDITL